MRDLIRKFAVLASTMLLTQVIAFVTLAFTTRRVGPSNLGAYTVALSLITFLSLPIASGITAVGTRDVAQRLDRARELTGEVFVLQLLLATAGYLAIVLLAPVIAPTQAMRSLLPIVGLFLFTGTSFEWALQALGRMRSIATARVAGQVAFGAMVPFLVIGGLKGMERYAWLMIGGLALKHLATAIYLVKFAGWPSLRVSPQRLWRRFKTSVPMSYASVMVQIYATIDSIMLGYLSTAYQVGQYAASGRIPGAIQTASGSWTAVVFPHSASLAKTDRDKLRRQTGTILSANAMVSLPLMVCTPFVARSLMVTTFGGQFGPAGTTLALGAVGIGIMLFDSTLSTVIIGVGGERRYARAITTTALLNIALNLPVIPLFGRNGAVLAALASESVLCWMLIRIAREQLGGVSLEWGRIARVAAACIPAVAALIIVPSTEASVWVRIALGAGVYAVSTVLFGAVRRAELRYLLLPRVAPAATTEPAVGAGRDGWTWPRDRRWVSERRTAPVSASPARRARKPDRTKP
jgi:O-antigen/teichoic acid export membrane protein